MTDLEVTLNGVTLPSNTSGTIYVYEDVGDDGGANSITVGGTTINYDNSDSVALSGGQTSYTLTGFDASSGNRIWPRYEIDNTDDVSTAELVEATDIQPPGQTISAPTSDISVTTPTPEVGFQIAGTVTLSGSGVSGATIYVVDADANAVETTTTTDTNGEYSVIVPNGATYHVAVQYQDGGTQYNALSKPFIQS